MKKITLFLLCFILFANAYFGCRKIAHSNELPEVNTGDTTRSQANAITVTGTVVTNDAPIQTSGHVWSSLNQLPTYSDNEGRSVIRGLLPDNKIISVLNNLSQSKDYFVRGYVISGTDTVYGKIITIPHLNTTGVSVTTGQVANITATTADVAGSINLPANAVVSQHGHVWSQTNKAPTLSDSSSKLGAIHSSVTFSSALKNLIQGTTFYVRAYAISDSVTLYGNTDSFTTVSTLAPTVITNAVTNITTSGATAGGNITAIGSSSVTQYGHVWSSTNNQPTINDSKTQLGAATAPITFNSTLANLSAGTTYYIRAYATNSTGTYYGSIITFTTVSSGTNLPTVITGNLGARRFDGLDASGTITDVGSSPITSCGFVFSDYGYFPDIRINIVYDLGAKNSTGSFTGLVAKLQPGTFYWMRAFATNSNGTSYGDTLSFTTKMTITTSQPFNYFSTTTDLIYGFIAAGQTSLSTVYEYGHVYSSTNPLPTINDSKMKNGPSATYISWGSSFTGLTPGTKYYVRAYGINDAGLEYSDTVSFIADALLATTLPVMGRTETTYVGLETIDMSGNVPFNGNLPITSYGYVYSASNKLPTVNDSKVDLGSTTNSNFGFSTVLQNLKGGTTYYIRSFAANSLGVSYGLLTPYTTQSYILPEVSTGDPVLQTPNVNFPGNVLYSGNTPVTQHGHVWSTTNPTPTLADNFNQLGSAPEGAYNSNLSTSVIKSGSTYYVRAYVTNNGGTNYGAVKTFSY